MARLSDIVSFRSEVTAGDLHGIISLHEILSSAATAFEKDAARVLASTYPSEAIRQLLVRLNTALSPKMADRKGHFLIHGGYGSGKSHLLCVLYHLLNSPTVGQQWLAAHGLEFHAPEDLIVILMPMTNLQDHETGRTVEYIWRPIFHQLGYTGFHHTGNNWPTVEDLKSAIAGRRAVVIIDELERWFLPIRDPHMRQANITFLQNFSEYASNPDNGYISIFTLLGIDSEVTDILQRPDRFQDDLTNAPDRRQIVLHRLVESKDTAKTTPVVDAYVDAYAPIAEQTRIPDLNRLRDEMIRCYPFHPETLDLVFQRYSSVARQDDRSYQNSRGALMLFAHVLQQTLDEFDGTPGALRERDLILPGDVSLAIDTVGDDLAMLNAELTQRARENLRESEQIDLAAPVLSTILLHSLGDPKEERGLGARYEDILRGCIRPASDASGSVTIGVVDAALARLEDTAIYLHQEQNPQRWLFKSEVSIGVQVNRRAANISKEIAQEILVEQLKDLLDARDVVVHPKDQLPNDKHVYLVLLDERVDKPEQILQNVYHGKAFPNGFIIIEPRDFGAVLDDNTLLWMAKRVKAAELMRNQVFADARARKQLQDIEETSKSAIQERMKDRYGAWRQPVFDESLNTYSFVRIDVPLSRRAVFKTVADRYTTVAYRDAVLEAVKSRQDRVPITVDRVRQEFYQQRSYPKPVEEDGPSEGRIDAAIIDLIKAAVIEVIDKGDGHYICGASPGILQKAWQLREAPDEHKPEFVMTEVIRFYFRQHPFGVPVTSVRAYCKQEAAKFKDVSVKDKDVDLSLIQLQGEGYITIAGSTAPLKSPLKGHEIVESRAGDGPSGPQPTITIGPTTVAHAKTDVVQQINVSDHLENVKLVVTATAGGQKALEEAGKLLTLPSARPRAGTRFAVTWTLDDAPISNRKELQEMLSSLPFREDMMVEIRLHRESTPSGDT